MKYLILFILFSQPLMAMKFNRINKDGLLIIRADANACIGGKNYRYNRITKEKTELTGTCSMQRVPFYHECRNGLAYKHTGDGKGTVTQVKLSGTHYNCSQDKPQKE